MFDKAAEYRYDGGRQRYLVRQRDPNEGFAIVGTGQWRDYLGEGLYNEYSVDAGGTVTSGVAHLPGSGYDDPNSADSPAYLGSDLIGTTRRVSNSAPINFDTHAGPPAIYRTVLTAFGESVSSTGSTPTGSIYAGRWGYETPGGSYDPLTELGWLHVGERYYDPAVGRFMQRDPIGIFGGLNVYAYVGNSPTSAVDPSGLWNPMKWLYTGDGNASEEVYNGAVQAAGEWIYRKSWARGGYVGVGTTRNRGLIAGAGIGWTIDQGFFAYACVGVQGSTRTRDPLTGRYAGGTGGIGLGLTYGEGGLDGGLFGGAGQNQKAHGGGALIGTDGTVTIGGTAGPFSGGIITDPGQLWD